MEVITPATGYLACGDTGAGKMPEPEVLFEYIVRAVSYTHLLWENLSKLIEKFCGGRSLNSTAFARENDYNVIQNVSQGGGAGVA